MILNSAALSSMYPLLVRYAAHPKSFRRGAYDLGFRSFRVVGFEGAEFMDADSDFWFRGQGSGVRGQGSGFRFRVVHERRSSPDPGP
eukprot:3940086-Rhodomonas_salina.1